MLRRWEMVRCGVVTKRERLCERLCESPVRQLILYDSRTRLFFVATARFLNSWTDKTDSTVCVSCLVSNSPLRLYLGFLFLFVRVQIRLFFYILWIDIITTIMDDLFRLSPLARACHSRYNLFLIPQWPGQLEARPAWSFRPRPQMLFEYGPAPPLLTCAF